MNLQKLNNSRYKNRLNKTFGGAARLYEKASTLQQDVGKQLLKKLPADDTGGPVLDLGSGTGYFLQALTKHYPKATILALDLSENMLKYRKSCLQEHVCFVQADAEKLPFKSNSVRRVFSNFVLQWCLDINGALGELKRVLDGTGEVFFSTLVAGSLKELEATFKRTDSQSRINSFYCAKTLKKLCISQQFEICNWEQKSYTLWYDNIQELIKAFKDIGANTAMYPGPGLGSKTRFVKFAKGYEFFRTSQGLPVTYEVLFGYIKTR